jgi:hypothetical protein
MQLHSLERRKTLNSKQGTHKIRTCAVELQGSVEAQCACHGHQSGGKELQLIRLPASQQCNNLTCLVLLFKGSTLHGRPMVKTQLGVHFLQVACLSHNTDAQYTLMEALCIAPLLQAD